ncbi:hypothetical protein L1987_45761 [Smallanthus sonchifolius]|uniref:Uncharacterized protein n=1 Tax=Smallanthus sonchifolius TaxID=185202 RepID=A0ACB9FYG0_9ASTR|nr:hypothetical protein L1987_45761 [Smallanthus sonchifolius]
MNPDARRPAHSAALLQSPHALPLSVVSLLRQVIHVASLMLSQQGPPPPEAAPDDHLAIEYDTVSPESVSEVAPSASPAGYSSDSSSGFDSETCSGSSSCGMAGGNGAFPELADDMCL